MSDEEFNPLKFRMLIVTGVAFAGLCVYSFMDLAYLALGREGTATVTDVYERRSRRSRSVNMDFTFQENGADRKGEANLGDVSEHPAVGDEIEIQYLPGWLLTAPDAARPKRGLNGMVLMLFLLATAGLAFFTYRAIYPPDEASDSRPRRARKNFSSHAQ